MLISSICKFVRKYFFMVYNIDQVAFKMSNAIDDKFWNVVEQFRDDQHVQESIEIIKKCYQKYKPEEVFLSFNGGKDCTVLLYLTMYVLKVTHSKHTDPIICLYIKSQHPFNELEQFIEQCQKLFNLQICSYCCDVKAGLGKLIETKPYLKACLMGTRRTDPHSSHLNHFQVTDANWPQVMRVSPILDWKYADIWNFLLTSKATYCELYDKGYTSLGNKLNTFPNPALKYIDESGEENYHPAWQLQDESLERSGRARL